MQPMSIAPTIRRIGPVTPTQRLRESSFNEAQFSLPQLDHPRVPQLP